MGLPVNVVSVPSLSFFIVSVVVPVKPVVVNDVDDVPSAKLKGMLTLESEAVSPCSFRGSDPLIS